MTAYGYDLFIIDRLLYVVLVALITPRLSISLIPLLVQSYDMNTSHISVPSLQWRHNGRDSVSNHQPHDVYAIVYSDADQRKHQSSASLVFIRGIHRGQVNSPHKWPVTRKMFPFDDVIMFWWDTASPLKSPHTGTVVWSHNAFFIVSLCMLLSERLFGDLGRHGAKHRYVIREHCPHHFL